MDIHINKNTLVSEIQAEFSQRFPLLKLEFFEENSRKPVSSETKIGSIRQDGHDGVIHVHGLLKTGEMEKSFSDVFGVHVQVFRKSGQVWLQTGSTDEKTLAEQNHMAAEMENPIIEEKEIPDWEERE